MRQLTCLIVLVFFFEPAFAQDELSRALAAYQDGRWDEAEALAIDTDTAEGQLIAAEATIAALLTFEDGINRERTAQRSVRYAEDALEKAPESSRAHQRLATALGLRARHLSPLRVWFARMPHRGRTYIDEAMQLTPDDPWVLGLSGAWHMEVVRKCGEGCLDSSLETGLAQYRTAAESAPDDPGIAYHLALALLAEDVSYLDEARMWLEQAIAAEPEDAFQRAVIDQSRSMLTILKDDPDQAIAEATRRLDS